MEQEYKWDFPEELCFFSVIEHPNLQRGIGAQKQISMLSVYYDTPNQLFFRMRGALRLRQENQERICCMKLLSTSSGACTTREEYEVPAKDIISGLKKLPGAGAPEGLCSEVLAGGVEELCRISFIRKSVRLQVTSDEESCVGELSFDEGVAMNCAKQVPIRELEYEFKSGSEALFHRTAAWIENAFSLKKQPFSKLTRVLRQ